MRLCAQQSLVPILNSTGQLAWRSAQALCKAPEHAHRGLLPGRLHQRDVGPIQAASTGQIFLGEAQLVAPSFDLGGQGLDEEGVSACSHREQCEEFVNNRHVSIVNIRVSAAPLSAALSCAQGCLLLTLCEL